MNHLIHSTTQDRSSNVSCKPFPLKWSTFSLQCWLNMCWAFSGQIWPLLFQSIVELWVPKLWPWTSQELDLVSKLQPQHCPATLCQSSATYNHGSYRLSLWEQESTLAMIIPPALPILLLTSHRNSMDEVMKGGGVPLDYPTNKWGNWNCTSVS